MKIRDNVNKTFCNEKKSNLKKQLHEKYKIYRNQIVTLIRVCKESYYQSFFDNNKTNLKAHGVVLHTKYEKYYSEP